jgi:hypothetical protein
MAQAVWHLLCMSEALSLSLSTAKKIPNLKSITSKMKKKVK